MLEVVGDPGSSRRRSVSSIATCIDSVIAVGVHDDLAADVAGRPADHLDQRPGAAQEALLVGVEDRDEGHLGQVDALAQEVDADEDVVDARGAGRAGSATRSSVSTSLWRYWTLTPELVEVVGQVLGHLLGQRRDERPLAALDAVADLLEEVVDLALGRADGDRPGRRRRSAG